MPTTVDVRVKVQNLAPPKVSGATGGLGLVGQPMGLLLALTYTA